MQKKKKKWRKKKRKVQIIKILSAQVSLAESFNDMGLTVAPNKYTVPITDDSVICPSEMAHFWAEASYKYVCVAFDRKSRQIRNRWDY